MAYVTREDLYRVSGLPTDGSVISFDDADMHILAAEEEVALRQGTSFQPGGREVTETLDGSGSDTLFVSYTPLRSVTSLTIDGTSVSTSELWVYSYGKVVLKSSAEATFFAASEPQQVVITYKYGYEPSQVVVDYTAALAAMRALIQQIGGTSDDVTSYSLPELTASKGEPYTNIRETYHRLKDLASSLRPSLPRGGMVC